MNNSIASYIDLLLSLNVSANDIDKTRAIINSTNEVADILDSPVVPIVEKETAVNELFPPSVRKAVLKISENFDISYFDEIADSYLKELDKQSNIARAVITCVNEPNEEQLEGLKKFVLKETDMTPDSLFFDLFLTGTKILQFGKKKPVINDEMISKADMP